MRYRDDDHEDFDEIDVSELAVEVEVPELAAVEIDPEEADALQAVSHLVRVAGREGLLVEAVKSFGEARAAGDSAPDACAYAQREWDLG